MSSAEAEREQGGSRERQGDVKAPGKQAVTSPTEEQSQKKVSLGLKRQGLRCSGSPVALGRTALRVCTSHFLQLL